MDGLMIPILVALVAALFCWGIFQVISSAFGGEKRKLKERLAPKQTLDEAGSQQRKSILLQVEATGSSAKLVQLAFFEKLHRKVIQAYPDQTLSKFLTICG